MQGWRGGVSDMQPVNKAFVAVKLFARVAEELARTLITPAWQSSNRRDLHFLLLLDLEPKEKGNKKRGELHTMLSEKSPAMSSSWEKFQKYQMFQTF